MHPVRVFGDDLGISCADFFFHFAKSGLARFFSLVDSPLRHLPMITGNVVASANEDFSLRIEQQDTHAGAKWSVVFCHVIRISVGRSWQP